MKKPTGANQKKEGVTFEHFEYIPEEWQTTEVNDLHQSPYFHFSNMFSSKQCDEVIEIGDTLEKIDSTIEDKGKVDNSIRQSKIAWMHSSPDTEWIYEWLYGSMHNTNFWKFDVQGFHDSIQYTTYEGSKAGKKSDFYNWHTDTGPGMNHRKVSMSVCLSDPKEYTGGDIELERGGRIKLKKGEAVMFPSFMLHKVHPVTSGVRKSLVIWFAGPHLK